jgi:PilZ domain-containing protein
VPSFERPPKPTPRDAGPKGGERIALCERCEFEIAGSGNPREGIIWNLSVVGLYLVLQADLPPLDAPVNVRLWLPGDSLPVSAETQVVWCNPPSPFHGCGAKALRFPPGCGLKFVDIAAADLARIQARVESVYSSRADPPRDPRKR